MRGPGRAVLAVGSVAVAVAVAVPGSSMADPSPSIDQVRHKVDTLNADAEKASERSNELHERMKKIDTRLDKIKSDIDHQQTRVHGMRGHIAAMAAAKFRSGGFDPTMKLLMAKNPDQFIDQMTSAKAIEGQQGDALTQLQAEENQLAEQKKAKQAELNRFRQARSRAADKHKQAEAKADKAQALLDRLTEEQRQRMLAQQRAEQREQQQRSQEQDRTSRDGDGRQSEPAPDPGPSTGRGATAVAFAEAQLGEPYVFGAAGPSSWDCSGLTMGAWQAAGVSLPHSAGGQYSAVGTKVSMSELQPGDLVMYYSSMHHVAIYVGGGQVIHAPRPGTSVQYAPVDSMPFAGAVRPG